ncbi:MAG: hypothetical protein ABI624_07830 [Casimicrobiaceae bacterium]
MNTYYDWHLIRGLTLMAVLALYVLYAVLVGAWERRKRGRTAKGITEQNALSLEQPKAPGSGERRALAGQYVHRTAPSQQGPARHAA